MAVHLALRMEALYTEAPHEALHEALRKALHEALREALHEALREALHEALRRLCTKLCRSSVLENKPATISRDETWENLLAGI